MTNDITRRDFIKKSSVIASVTIAGGGLLSTCQYPVSKGLTLATLGKTGVEIPRIGLGLGSRFCAIGDEDKALELLNYALDNGLYYWDTASIYQNNNNGVVSEERIGKILKERRNEVFLSTKFSNRDPDEAMREIEQSLKRLQVDQVDQLMIHNVQAGSTMEFLEAKGGPIEIAHRMREEGITRFIGYSGHTEASALKYLAENYDFDTMLMALNHYKPETNFNREEVAVSAADKNRMGVMLMKVIRPRENNKSLKPSDLINYALSLKKADGLVIGIDSKKVVDSNLEILRNFKPLEKEKMEEIGMQLSPFYRHENIPWMKKGYQDGNWI